MTQREDLVCFANISISPVRAAYKITRQSEVGAWQLVGRTSTSRVEVRVTFMARGLARLAGGVVVGDLARVPLWAPSRSSLKTPVSQTSRRWNWPTDFVLWRFFALRAGGRGGCSGRRRRLGSSAMSAGVVCRLPDAGPRVRVSPIGTFGFLSSQMVYWRFTASSIAECPTVFLISSRRSQRYR